VNASWSPGPGVVVLDSSATLADGVVAGPAVDSVVAADEHAAVIVMSAAAAVTKPRRRVVEPTVGLLSGGGTGQPRR